MPSSTCGSSRAPTAAPRRRCARRSCARIYTTGCASAIKDADNAIADGYRATRERLLGRFERRFLQQLVTQADGNVSRAARIARLNRTTLYRLMERYGLQRKLLASDLEEPEE